MRAVQLRWNLSLNFRLTNLERGAQSASAVTRCARLVRYMDHGSGCNALRSCATVHDLHGHGSGCKKGVEDARAEDMEESMRVATKRIANEAE
jgi:hypothetical protein